MFADASLITRDGVELVSRVWHPLEMVPGRRC